MGSIESIEPEPTDTLPSWAIALLRSRRLPASELHLRPLIAPVSTPPIEFIKLSSPGVSRRACRDPISPFREAYSQEPANP